MSFQVKSLQSYAYSTSGKRKQETDGSTQNLQSHTHIHTHTPTENIHTTHLSLVPAGSSSHGGDVVVYVKDMNQPSLPTPFYSVLMSIHVFTALSTIFHTINSPENSPLSTLFFRS